MFRGSSFRSSSSSSFVTLLRGVINSSGPVVGIVPKTSAAVMSCVAALKGVVDQIAVVLVVDSSFTSPLTPSLVVDNFLSTSLVCNFGGRRLLMMRRRTALDMT